MTQRILIVNVNWLGDVIFSTPVFKALKKEYPDSRITCLAVPRVKPILECVPGIDEVLVYDEKGKDRGLLGKLRIINELRRREFTMAFLLHGSWTRSLLVFLAGIPVRVGYAKKNRFALLTHHVEFLGVDAHKSDIYLNVIEAFGIAVYDRTCELRVKQESREEIDGILKAEGINPEEPFFVLHTSGNWDLKRWSKQCWADLIRKLNEDLKMKVIISEGPAEKEWADEICRLSGGNPIVLSGKTDLQQLMALLEKAKLVISADSGPLHIASAVSKNIIGIFGPTTPETTGPRGKAQAMLLKKDVGCNRASCYYLACPNNVCMQAVSVNEVLEAVKNVR